MEQITLTKNELIEIVEREVSKRLDGKKPIRSCSIFNKVKIKREDFDEINKKLDFKNYLSVGRMEELNYPIPIKKYPSGYESVHRKVFVQDVHDLIRKLTLSAFGVTLNSDLSEKEYGEAARIYELIKGYYLHQYQRRIEKLTIDDFE
uniref:Uncharacterized protein n=1 Tax=Staphylococcus phage HS14 TaxID=3056404 RepID=A0AA50ACL8_9VIRU|nr:MAG: hypothetical protein [Staphylococcus phage HS14]